MLARMGEHPERGFGVSPQFDPRGDACANLASSSVAWKALQKPHFHTPAIGASPEHLPK
jgi:hypothetical protein